MITLTNRDLIIVDVETSGSNPFAHEILAIGLMPMDNIIPAKTIYIKHKKIIWNSFAKENFKKFSFEWENEAIEPEAACTALENYLAQNYSDRKVTLVGHNIGFDVSFLKKLAFQGNRVEFSSISHRAIDTHTLLYLLNLENKIPKWALSSDGAFKFFNVEVPLSERHTALGDADATKRLIEKISNSLF